MKKRLLSILKYLIFLGIGIFLMWWQLSKMTALQRIQFEESLRNAHYIYIIPITALAILSHISRAVRWKILIEPMGYIPSTANTFYATMCGYFANTFVPRAGEILRCTMLGRYEKIPVTKLIGTILVERTFDLFCYFFVIIITILIQIQTVSDFVKSKLEQISNQKHIGSAWWIILILVGVGGLIILFIRWLFNRHSGHRHIIKLKGLHVGLKEGFYAIIHLKKRKYFIAHTLFIWVMYLMEVYVGFYALSATSSLGIGAALSVLSLSTLAMIIAPGGIGAFPVAVQQVLLIYNIDNISFGWLMWGVSTGIIIIVGIICFGLIIYYNKNKNEKE
ncbi:MAG: lysylphosphatidylglycerol synthase transmembrane domain-containing protein [Bacteroidota bacterium]|nr:lysylphosphatidylglycerol synthase transmembrane domain-containing protein [Bacteroidota bacterium]